MTETDRISVIVTTYNAPHYLERVLAGYLRQSRAPDELLVADDGSTAETADVVERFRATAPFPVLHVWHEDRGFRAAKIRNEAIKASRGEYLIFTDGDCIPHQSFVEDHAGLAAKGWFVQGKRMLVQQKAAASFRYESLRSLWRSCLRGEVRGCHHLLRLPGIVRCPVGVRGIKTCNFAVHRAAAVAVNGFNEAFEGWGREDAEFAARLLASGCRRKDPLFSALVFHLWHPENSRAALAENDRILAEAIAGGVVWCREGIEKS